MSAKFPTLFCLAFFGLLSGACTTIDPTPSAPPSAVPIAPAIELPPASITGSEETSTMLDNFTVFVAAVDGVPVTAGRDGWNTAVPLKAGQRRLTLVFNRGVFASQTEIDLTATSETAYQVKFATDAQLFGKNSYCEFWVANAVTGESVTARVRAPLSRIEAPK